VAALWPVVVKLELSVPACARLKVNVLEKAPVAETTFPNDPAEPVVVGVNEMVSAAWAAGDIPRAARAVAAMTANFFIMSPPSDSLLTC
jgi:hypothetical protein